MAYLVGGFIPLMSPTNWGGVIDWWYEQDSAMGTTKIKATVKTYKTDSLPSAIDGSSFSGSLVVAGTSKNFSYSTESDSSTNRATVEATVKHTGSGKLLECVISCTVNSVSSTGTIVLSGNKNVAPTIPTIHMDSYFDAINDIDFGKACSITWTPDSASYHYKLRFEFENQSYTTGVISPNRTSQYTYSGYTIPLSWMNSIPNSAYGVVTITLTAYTSSACTTVVGQPFIGAFIASVPSTVVPTVSSCSAAIDNSLGSIPTTSTWNGIAVSGHTQVVISASGAGAYGSTIRSYTITGAAAATIPKATMTGSDAYKTGIIYSAGAKVFIVTCTDTRGRVSSPFTISPAINFLAYSKPFIRTVLMSRTKSTDNSIHPAITAQWESTNLSGKNTSTAKLYYKKSTSVNWTTYTGSLTVTNELLSDGVTRKYSITKTTLNIAFADDSSYDFRLIVTDTLQQRDEKDGFISSSEVQLDLMAGGKGIGIGKICEDEGVEFGFDATFFGAVKIKVGSVIKTLGDYITSFLDPLKTVTVTLSVNGWSTSSPYKQRVNVSGMTASKNYGPPYISGYTTADSVSAAKEALSCIDGGTTGDGYVEFVCYSSPPSTDVTVKMRGEI